MLALNKRNLTFVQNVQSQRTSPSVIVATSSTENNTMPSTSTTIESPQTPVEVSSSTKTKGVSPPSSFCGSECLYSTLDIQKFFNSTKPVVPPPPKEEETVNTTTLKDDEIELNDEKITDFCCDRNTTSLPTATADTITTPTTSTIELPKSPPAVQRQTKFGFYNKTSEASKFILQDLSSVASQDTSSNKKQVRFVPNVIDSLFEGSVGSSVDEPCLSFASSFSDDDSALSSDKAAAADKFYGRITSEQRLKILADCRLYRIQITSYEDTFLKEHCTMPKSTQEKSGLSEIYQQYRENKRIIRGDAATKIQSLIRGKLIRLQWSVALLAASEVAKANAAVKKAKIEAERAAEEEAKVADDKAKALDVEREEVATDQQGTESTDFVLEALGGNIIYDVTDDDTITKQNITMKDIAFVDVTKDEEIHTAESIKDMAQNFIKQIDTVRSTLAVTRLTTTQEEKAQEEKTGNLLENTTVPKGIDLNQAVQDMIFVPTTNEKEPPELSGDATSSTTALPAKITVELIPKYLTPEDKSRIATKVLSSKLQGKEFKLPQYTDAPEAMCDVCEMPKLATKNGTIPDECFVCDALYKKIVKRAKKEEKKKKATEVVAATDINEKKSRMRAKEYEMERKQAKEWLRREKYRGMDWSASVPSTVRMPADVYRASRRKERRDAAKSSNCSSGTDSSPIQKEQDEECRILSPASSSDDSSAYDNLLDDECVRELQRKIHGSPFPIKNGAEQPFDGKSEMKSNSRGVKENDAGVSYEEISQLYEEFEKEHADVVNYARQRVGHRSGGRSSNRQDNSRRIRSSSAPSVSSFSESRDYEERRYHGRDRRHREYHHNHDSSDSMSELSYECDYHYRRGPRYSSRRGDRYVDKDRSSRRRPRGYRSQRHEHSRYHMNMDDSYSDEYLPRRRTRGARGTLTLKDLLNSGRMRGGELSFDFY